MNVHLRILHLGAYLLLGLFLNACVSIEWSEPIPTRGLDGLTLGESTQADVVLALGEPRGEGGAVVSQEPIPREFLFYEYITSDGKRAELEILLVFMAMDRYDGHLWFAATDRIRQESRAPGSKLPEKIEKGTFPGTAPLEAQFQRGRTSREEVVKALGEPIGTGGALFPPEHRASEVLYYEDVQLTDPVQRGDYFVYRVQQRILLVLIVDGVYDGFMWYSTAGAPTAKAQ
jgi:hypothetical protein